jgi:anti-sigma regulatory factor (Ser/Thr protein kinase)
MAKDSELAGLPVGLEQAVDAAIRSAFKFDKEFFQLPLITCSQVCFEEYYVDASSYDDVEVLRLKLEDNLPKYGMGEDDANKYIFAILEAVQNAQQHSLNFEKGRQVRIHAMYTPYWDQFSVIYGGKPLDIELLRNLANRAYPLNEIHKGERGRGWTIMLGLCNIVHPTTDGSNNQVMLMKFKNPSEGYQAKNN